MTGSSGGTGGVGRGCSWDSSACAASDSAKLDRGATSGRSSASRRAAHPAAAPAQRPRQRRPRHPVRQLAARPAPPRPFPRGPACGGLRRLPGLLSGRRLAGGRWRLLGLVLGCGRPRRPPAPVRPAARRRVPRRPARPPARARPRAGGVLGRRDRTAPRCRTGRQVESSSLLSQLHVRTEALVGGTRRWDLVADRFRMRQGFVDRLGDQVVLGPAPVELGPLPGRVLDRRRPPRHRRGRERDRRPRPVGDLRRRRGRRPGSGPRRPRLPRRADRRAQDQPGAEGQQHHADHDHHDRERTHVAHARRSGTPTSLTGPPPIGHDPAADTYP